MMLTMSPYNNGPHFDKKGCLHPRLLPMVWVEHLKANCSNNFWTTFLHTSIAIATRGCPEMMSLFKGAV